MGQQQYPKAAHAFSQAVELTGRHPEILAQWAQAEFFAQNNQWSDELQLAVDTVLTANPNDVTTLGFVGIAAFESGNYSVALDAWSRLLDQMDPRDPSAQAVLTGIQRAEEAVQTFGEHNANASAGPVLPTKPEQVDLTERGRIYITVDVAEAVRTELRDDDTVFVFARSAENGQMPLAAQRFTVAQLPAEVLLSDADAVMPQMALSATAEVVVQASISREGNASAPDWLSETKNTGVDTGAITDLVIQYPSR